MGFLKNLKILHNYQKTIYHLAMLTSIVAAAAFTSSSPKIVTAQAQPDATIVNKQQPAAIPFCDEKSENNIGRRLLFVTTLDGRLSALDVTKSGKVHWSIATGPGPLISSSIHRLELTNNGQFVRMIPSLSGGIYKFDGESIDPIPITTDNLLSSSGKFSEDLVISGGKETRTYGVSARTGKLLYECTMHGCINSTNVLDRSATNPITESDNIETEQSGRTVHAYRREHDPLIDDVIVVRRQTQTVRAVESRTGLERWNFSVGQHELDMIRSGQCHDRPLSDLDMAIMDLDIKVIVPEGVICAFSKSNSNSLLWKYKFDHPIVSAWKVADSDELESVDMFGTAAQWLWDNENIFEAPHPSISPSIYLGIYRKQLYIQESVHLRRELDDHTSDLYNHLAASDGALVKIPWRPIVASSNSLVLVGNGKIITGTDSTIAPTERPQHSRDVGKELVPYNDDQFALTAMSVLNCSETVNGNGFYLYATENTKVKDDKSGNEIGNENEEFTDCETDDGNEQKGDVPAIGNDKRNEKYAVNRTYSDDLGFSLDDIDAPIKVVILSLWFWWKEIVVIAFTSAVLLNLFMGQRQRSEREIVIIERHIPVPTGIEATETSTAAILGPVNNSSSKSNGFSTGHRSLSESTSHSGENFSSRFQEDFDLVRCLGRGGFGVVFEAKNKLDDRHYAIKRITLPNKKESKERVMREVRTLAKCEHQNIVRYFNAWTETPPIGWQEEEDKKWLSADMSTSIQIETPDGTTMPSIESSLMAHANIDRRKMAIEKKKQLMSWVSNVTSTTCSDDFQHKNVIEEDDEDDSCIVFRSESQSLALREVDEEDESNSTEVVSSKGKQRQRNDSVAIDIHSDSFDLCLSKNGQRIDYSQLSDSFQIEFVRSANGEQELNEEDQAENSKVNGNTDVQRRRRALSLDLSKEQNNNSKALLPALATGSPQQNSFKTSQNKVYLYIQMEVCLKKSLRDWLRENTTESRKNRIASIFHQIVDAVHYVHGNGLIHRDLKPSNIFFAKDGQIKIGDFGLVTDMSDIPNLITDCSDNSGLPQCKRHTQQVGTHLYMSPEQLRGEHYDFKVDIYSLGLIFFELLVYFGTEMERMVTMRSLRDGKYPAHFPENHPEEHELLKLMLSNDPNVRPTTADLKQPRSWSIKSLLQWKPEGIQNSLDAIVPTVFNSF